MTAIRTKNKPTISNKTKKNYLSIISYIPAIKDKKTFHKQEVLKIIRTLLKAKRLYIKESVRIYDDGPFFNDDSGKAVIHPSLQLLVDLEERIKEFLCNLDASPQIASMLWKSLIQPEMIRNVSEVEK